MEVCRSRKKCGVCRELTITGTGLKKCSPIQCQIHGFNAQFGKADVIWYAPTTLEVLSLPTSDAAVFPSGIALAAIFVIEMDDVFVANIASGLNSLLNSVKIFCFNVKFSDTAYPNSTIQHKLQPLSTTL